MKKMFKVRTAEKKTLYIDASYIDRVDLESKFEERKAKKTGKKYRLMRRRMIIHMDGGKTIDTGFLTTPTCRNLQLELERLEVLPASTKRRKKVSKV